MDCVSMVYTPTPMTAVIMKLAPIILVTHSQAMLGTAAVFLSLLGSLTG